jgi:hypothetical protein
VKHTRDAEFALLRCAESGEVFATADSAAQHADSFPVLGRFLGAELGAAVALADGSGAGFGATVGRLGRTDGSRPVNGTLSGSGASSSQATSAVTTMSIRGDPRMTQRI